MLIEIHIIQNHSPSNLNRDDLGAPKTCIFGGVPRARISSQCIKRSIRNPGNREDIHNRGPGVFAKAMAGHIGTKTKFFPWLVKQELDNSQIPEDERQRIVRAAQRIAVGKEKEERAKTSSAKADLRPRTAQLIHLGPGHARFFVSRLARLREQSKECYDYFLDPAVGFQEMVREHLDEGSDLNEKDQEKIAKVSWIVAKCRMSELPKAPDGQEPEPDLEMHDNQPGAEQAKLVADQLSELFHSDPKRFKELTRKPTREEAKEGAPDRPKEIDEFKKALKEPTHCDAVDIALFGRMTTSEAFEDVEAAMQVAHAISTHAVVNEVDYFTAVDDLGKAGGGAGHVDEAQFNSACFYKYFSLDWEQLLSNLAGPEPDRTDQSAHKKWLDELRPNAERLAAGALGHFIRAAAQSTPSGKQNSFASFCEPCGILVEIKKNGNVPTNYANAFAEPVERVGKPEDDAPDEQSWEGRSVACLADHVHSLRQAYNMESTLLWYSPKLWRFPLRYWKRSEDGKKTTHELVTKRRFEVLVGEQGKSPGLLEAVVKEATGLDWKEVCDVARREVQP